jgi:hypothetical protein
MGLLLPDVLTTMLKHNTVMGFHKSNANPWKTLNYGDHYLDER